MRRMRIAVAGATGNIGSLTVAALERAGHDVVRISRSLGVDLRTGDGLDAALTGVEAVNDATSHEAADRDETVAFFGTTTRNLLAAEERAGVRHHVLLSIVGVDRATTLSRTGDGPRRSTTQDHPVAGLCRIWEAAAISSDAVLRSSRTVAAVLTLPQVDGVARPLLHPSVRWSASGGGDWRASELVTCRAITPEERARQELAGLAVAPHGSMRGYSRAKFPHWAQQGEGSTPTSTTSSGSTSVTFSFSWLPHPAENDQPAHG